MQRTRLKTGIQVLDTLEFATDTSLEFSNERPPWQDSIRKGCTYILNGAPILEGSLPEMNFYITCMSQSTPAKLKLFALNYQFTAEIPVAKPGKVTLNGLDVTDIEKDNLILIQFLRDIYRRREEIR